MEDVLVAPMSREFAQCGMHRRLTEAEWLALFQCAGLEMSFIRDVSLGWGLKVAEEAACRRWSLNDMPLSFMHEWRTLTLASLHHLQIWWTKPLVVLPKLPNLKSLELLHSNMGPDLFRNLSQTCPNLHELSVSLVCNQTQKPEMIQKIFLALSMVLKTNSPPISRFTLQQDWDRDSVLSALRVNQSITDLHVIAPRHLKGFHPSPHVRFLTVTWSHGENGFHLNSWLSSAQCQLLELHVDDWEYVLPPIPTLSILYIHTLRVATPWPRHIHTLRIMSMNVLDDVKANDVVKNLNDLSSLTCLELRSELLSEAFLRAPPPRLQLSQLALSVKTEATILSAVNFVKTQANLFAFTLNLLFYHEILLLERLICQEPQPFHRLVYVHVGALDHHHECRRLRTQITRNRDIRQNWKYVAPLLAFLRANRHHPFQYSVFPLLESIATLSNEPFIPADPRSTTILNLDKFVDAKFTQSHLSK